MLRLGRHSALLVFALAAQVSYGQWDTNSLWPAWKFPRSTNGITTNILTRQLWQVYSALVERCDAVGTNLVAYPVAPGQTNAVVTNKSERAILIHYKDKAKTLLTNFLDHTKADSGGIYPSNATFQTWNVSNLSYAINIPSNYFDVTFWRFLSGLGVYEDTNVGHRVGYTNFYTQNAGTNFTGYRDKWYTTDYGVDELRRVIGQMRQVVSTNIIHQYVAGTNWAVENDNPLYSVSAIQTQLEDDWYLYYTPNFSEWLTDTGEYVSERGPLGGFLLGDYRCIAVSYEYEARGSDDVFSRNAAAFEVNKAAARVVVTNVFTGMVSYADFYVRAEPPELHIDIGSGGGTNIVDFHALPGYWYTNDPVTTNGVFAYGPAPTNEFYAHGFGITSKTWSKYHSSSYTGAIGVYTGSPYFSITKELSWGTMSPVTYVWESGGAKYGYGAKGFWMYATNDTKTVLNYTFKFVD